MGLLDITGVGEVADLIKTGINKICPDADAEQKREAEQLFMEATQRYSAIISEANSQDKWTSRARPSFLYVVYILLLTSIPFGICYTISPGHAEKFVTGFQAWFKAIPSDLYALFGAVMMGYTFARSYEKKNGVTK